ncbi:hypothetical protein LTR08_006864 [Meristemomyces frigidus]|nr:hypothetical protein LTR08_006864 [Meristemomyces frigidus]
MVHSMFPIMSYDQLYEDRERALEQTPVAGEQLPAYAEATKDKSPINVTEKEFAQKQPKSKNTEKWATVKGILSGKVHQHNPRYALEEFHTGKPSAAREQRQPSTKAPGSTSSASKST